MSLDAGLVVAFVLVFARVTAMMLTSPFFGSVVPGNIRVMFCGVLSLALVPVVKPHLGPVPTDLITMTLLVGHEVVTGLIIGGFLYLLAMGAQMAGAMLDLQLGLSSAAVFNPAMGASATPVAQFHYMLAVVLLFLTNGHQIMLQAFIKSYSLPGPSIAAMPTIATTVISFIGMLSLLALQIAAPVGAVCLVMDVAAGVVNKAVPQTQPFLLAMPAKMLVGIFVLSLGLPALVVAVQSGMDFTMQHLSTVLGGT